MNSQMSGLAISLGVMQLGKKVPTDRPDILFIIRCSYVFMQLLTFGLYYYAGMKIKQKNDTTVLKYTEPAKGFNTTDPGTPVVTTVRDYDLKQVSSNTPGQLIGIVIMAVMHFKFGYTQPLLIQSIMPLKSLYDSKILKIHVLGQPAVGDLKRPFAQPPGLMSALNEANQASQEADQAAIAANEPVSSGAKITEIKEEESKKDL